MPGHMNVLLAEADVPYDLLIEMEDINPRMEMMDVAIVIGANDVVNPAAREMEDSPIYGMPIINVDYARTVFVLKRTNGGRFCRCRQPAVLRGKHPHAVRGRQGIHRRTGAGVQFLANHFRGQVETCPHFDTPPFVIPAKAGIQ